MYKDIFLPLYIHTNKAFISFYKDQILFFTALTNPLLYGYMNENFKREFSNIFRHFKNIWTQFSLQNSNSENNNGQPLQSLEQVATYEPESAQQTTNKQSPVISVSVQS